MAVNYNSARFLIHARSMGIAFDRTLTLGRQNLSVTARDLVSLFNEYGETVTLDETVGIKRAGNGYSEEFFKHLGASSVASMDAHEYESATIIHDLNVPMPESMRQSFSVVFDGGTLEHVFNFPTAVRSCMEALEAGGHFIGVTPVNNMMGHGFYQFSPELIYRIFSKENGFEVRCLYICEDRSPYQWYEVVDPQTAYSRIVLTNFCPTYLLFVAQRKEVRPIFAQPPLQSDYKTDWKNGSCLESGLKDLTEKPPLSRRLLPGSLKTLLRPIYMFIKDAPLLLPKSRFSKRFYRKIPRGGAKTPGQNH